MSDVIELRVLGPLEVHAGGEGVRVAGDKERAVLALLLVQAGEVVSTDRLVDRLWGDDLPANPANALQAVVSRLRRALGQGVVVTKKPGYALDVPPAAVDARRFEELLGQARESEDPAAASTLLGDALELWRGEPFADLPEDDLARQERARLEELHAAAMEEKAAADLALGRNGVALALLDRLVAAYPLRERPRALTMVALYREGRQADALAVYQETRKILGEELGVDPGPDLDDLYQRILRQDPSLAAPRARAASPPNLPPRITSFVGRDDELREVTSLVRENRLVTLLGPGGAGKTSLAVEAARASASSFGDGVFFVELAPVADPALVAAAVADALGLSDDGSAAAPTRVEVFLRARESLLVFDNCEHVVQAAAEIADTLLRSCPRVAILATSREVIASPGELVWTIPPLAIPEPGDPPESVASFDAVRLLVERASSAGAEVTLDDEGAAAAAQICRRLDGLPLAIELAAARARSLSLRDIAERLDQRFALLTAGGRTTQPRHRTLRAAIDWSYDLLSPAEQVLFARLAIFSGGWTLDAAEEICGDAAVGDVLDVQARLVDQSLVVARDGRFRMLETVLAYARERLAETGDAGVLRERHARFFERLAVASEPLLRGDAQARTLARLRAEEHNLRLALQWGRAHAAEHPDVGLGLAAALGWYWYVGRQVEGRSELTAMLAAAPTATDETRARALQALSLALRPAGCIVHANAGAAAAARESAAIFEAAGDRSRAALSELLVAVEGVAGGDVGGFLATVEGARSALRDADDSWGMALADFVEMEIRLYHDSPDRALSLGEDAARRFDALADSWGRSAVRLHLGFGLRLAGRVAEARTILGEAVSISRATGLPNNLARSLAELGELAVHSGDPKEAEHWFTECDEIAADLADETMLALVAAGRGDLARLVAAPGDALRHYASALTRYERADVPRGVARSATGSAAAALDLGDSHRARELLEHALPLARDGGDAALLAGTLEQAARLRAAEGNPAAAHDLLQEANEIRVRSRRPRGVLAERDTRLTGPRATTPSPRRRT